MSQATEGREESAQASNGDLVLAAQVAVNERDLSLVRELITEETSCRFPDKTCTGPEEIVAYFEDTFEAIPDRHVEVLAMVEQDENVIMRFHLTGTQSGAFAGLPATGKPLSIHGFEHFVVRDGKVVSSYAVSDQLDVARQIGLVPPEGSFPDRAMKAAFGMKTNLARRFGRAKG